MSNFKEPKIITSNNMVTTTKELPLTITLNKLIEEAKNKTSPRKKTKDKKKKKKKKEKEVKINP